MAAHVASDGVRLHVEIGGSDDAPTVVLVHGLAASTSLGWRATGVLDRLTAAGMRTIGYDARGHGNSEGPHDPQSYGDMRLAADLTEIVEAFAGPSAVVAGYSMGATTVLFALSAGLSVRGAVLGGTPKAVLRWSDQDEMQRSAAVEVLEGRAVPDPAMRAWLDFLDATGSDKAALAACLRSHRPEIRHWDRIGVPMVVAAGVDDVGAARPADIVAFVRDSRPLLLAGNHYSAVTDAAFTNAIVELTRSSTDRPSSTDEQSS
jgi:pimeloyl-ACP methyl ester carboxylesterase